MNIVCISRESDSRGEEFARELAHKLGYQSLSRGDLVEAAIEEGIPVGRLETAMIKPQLINEALLLQKEYYQAFATATLCEKALAGNLLYHGRTGHLLLPGVTQVMKVRVVESQDTIINAVMKRMNVSWEKAKKYVQDVNEDIQRWVKTYYNVDWDQYSNYHLLLNLDDISVGNAATALCAMAQLPEFHGTPATRKALMDLLLAAKVRIALARDERTYRSRFHVTSDQGVVSVTYQPQDESMATVVPEVVSSIDSVSELHCTMASSHILWIQERYDDCHEICDQIIDLAQRYNAAVELVRYVPGPDIEEVMQARGEDEPSMSVRAQNGWIEDDVAEPAPAKEVAQLRRAYNRLAQGGVAGGTKLILGPTNHLVDSLNPSVSYFLVVVGELFLSKGHAARVRMTRELSGVLTENLRAPVVTAEEINKTYMFGPRQGLQLILSLAVAVFIIFLTFKFQVPILSFLREEGTAHRMISAGILALLVPAFAYLYGTFARNILKLLKME